MTPLFRIARPPLTALMVPVAVLALSVGGCGPSAPEATLNAEAGGASGMADTVTSAGAGQGETPGDARAANGTGSITDSFAITNPDIAASLPDFVRMPPGARVIVNFPFSNGIRKGGSIMANTPMPRGEVIAFHRQAMTRDGLVLKPDETGREGETILTAESPDEKTQYTVSVFLSQENGTLFRVGYYEPVA
ncbi:MAG: hypothetical protein A2792_04650 [Sphingomonadales bacterium RIFCSPHIGHO2_01_FULL_65_20]|nr:MAG: hypothetical protein A2792_04650 [Sphingomonadales bacterium RIFCSPHIGHO2_01_FULL_65_20]